MEYVDLLKTTIDTTYPKYLQEKIIKILMKNNVIASEENLFTVSGTTVKVEEKSFINQINAALEYKSLETIKTIEELEYYNAYKYSTIFNCNNYDENIVNKLIDTGNILRYDEINHDICVDFNKSGNFIPTFRKVNATIDCLKFSNQIQGFIPFENSTIQIKYPILVLIHKDLNTVEIRLNYVKNMFKNNDDNFYEKQIRFVKSWIEKYLHLNLEPVNMSPILDYLRRKLTDDANVKIAAQKMVLATGSKAILDTGINDELVLPLLGELKNLIADNSKLFDANDQTKEIKELLDNFIYETEETALFPWISLTWTNEVKSKAVKVKFILDQEFTLLYYYGNNAGMERMNDVTKYLIDCQREYLGQKT